MATPRWLVLVHQIPPRPLYLRARIRQRLERAGAVPVKNSVYALPQRPACLEDLQWIAQEIVAGGGDAVVCAADLVLGLDDEALSARFRELRAADYETLTGEARDLMGRLAPRRASTPASTAGPVARLERRLQEITAIDFFAASGRAPAEAAIARLKARLAPRPRTKGATGSAALELLGKAWVTRRGVHVDRIATVWLVRRFLDPAARVRFVDDERAPARHGEVRFDMVGGELTHVGERCTFEVLLERLVASGVLRRRDRALTAIAEIVHDIDLKDDRFDRPETAGIERLLAGLCRTHAADEARLEHGARLFDDLYSALSYRARSPVTPQTRRPRRAT